MNLVIHDLKTEEWKELEAEYAGWRVVSDDGTIRPCVGCFSCWTKTPGQCVIRDGYENMGALIHEADEVVVVSRYTYGGFSGFVKNVFDRSLGYVLPQFEVIRDETHHKKRYDEDKPFSFIFYGQELGEEEKESARRYVQAVCTNIRGFVKEVVFREKKEQTVTAARTIQSIPGKVILLNGSMRCADGNSAKLARKLARQLKNEPEILNLKDYLKDPSGLIRVLEKAEVLVLCVPLYVDGLPSQVLRLMERFPQEYGGSSAKIYVLANMGLYESRQLVNLFDAVRQWCGKTDLEYCGGLGISAGELLGTLMQAVPFKLGATRKAALGMEKLAAAVNAGEKTEEIYAEPYLFPRSLYIWIANNSWKKPQ